MPSALVCSRTARFVDVELTRQVRHRRDLLFPLNAVDNRQRILARAAAGAVGHRAEVGMELAQRWNRFFQQRALSLGCLGREELERHHGPASLLRGVENIADEVDQRVPTINIHLYVEDRTHEIG